MKNTIRAAKILTWFNLIVWGSLLGIMLLAALASQNMVILVAVVLFGVIPLHSYASLQLQKSIRHPAIKLSSQTPVGVRFIGFIALFFGILAIGRSFELILNPKIGLDSLNTDMGNGKTLDEATQVAALRIGIGFAMLMGLAVVINVILNLRLLRWYYLVRQSDINQGDVS